MEIEIAVAHPGVAVEVALLAYLGPGRVDAQGDDRQQQIHYPEAEIFACVASELEGIALLPGDRRCVQCNGFGLLEAESQDVADASSSESDNQSCSHDAREACSGRFLSTSAGPSRSDSATSKP